MVSRNPDQSPELDKWCGEYEAKEGKDVLGKQVPYSLTLPACILSTHPVFPVSFPGVLQLKKPDVPDPNP